MSKRQEQRCSTALILNWKILRFLVSSSFLIPTTTEQRPPVFGFQSVLLLFASFFCSCLCCVTSGSVFLQFSGAFSASSRHVFWFCGCGPRPSCRVYPWRRCLWDLPRIGPRWPTGILRPWAKPRSGLRHSHGDCWRRNFGFGLIRGCSGRVCCGSGVWRRHAAGQR